MTDAAARLFATVGYAGTTMEAVAQASGLSVQGVYFAFQNKPNLLQAAIDAARPERPARTSLTDPDALLRQLVDDACADLERTGALALAAASAAPVDETVAAMHARLEAQRSRAAGDLVSRLRSLRPLAPGVTARRAADVVFGLLSPQLHGVMVRDRGWTTKRYAGWVAGGVERALWG